MYEIVLSAVSLQMTPYIVLCFDGLPVSAILNSKYVDSVENLTL